MKLCKQCGVREVGKYAKRFCSQECSIKARTESDKPVTYVRLPENLDRRKKLTKEQIGEIQRLYAGGEPIARIARSFGVSDGTIHYHCKGEEYRRNWNDKIIARITEARKQPEEMKKHLEREKESAKYRRRVHKPFGKYYQHVSYRWRHKSPENMEKWREWNRKQQAKRKRKKEALA